MESINKIKISMILNILLLSNNKDGLDIFINYS